MSKKYFVTGIGTSVGKTIVSAVLVKLWNAEYWKPIQSGDLESSDSLMLRALVGNELIVHPERFKLNTPASPHYSAEVDGVEISIQDFQLPETNGNLIVEGAGGMFVPINDQEFIIDLAEHLDLPVILVCSDYLGSINHSLLSFHSLNERGITVEYIVLNGEFKESSRRILIKNKPAGSKIMEIPQLETLDAAGLENAINKIRIEK
ncbi:dethiobiotin synthase [Sphingobacterium mizutaii]|uniref:dethiobiotin synthase n=1 Tax=Sphingobacterium mizutaii TaxID=1010 RepID=UPI0028977DEF|nr:dethiobiotin synthase [Sphingobacterium mizutaii]